MAPRGRVLQTADYVPWLLMATGIYRGPHPQHPDRVPWRDIPWKHSHCSKTIRIPTLQTIKNLNTVFHPTQQRYQS
jgi:hypothetical protein